MLLKRSRMAINRDADNYKYTKNDLFITEAQRDFYEINGYLVVRKLVEDKLLEECKQRFLDICNDKVNQKPLVVVKDFSLISKDVKGEFLINKMQDFPYDDVFFKYISYKPMIDIVSSIIGPDITVFHNMLINKPPNSDPDTSRHPLHQDLHYFPIRPAHSIVASWTAMENINEKNGCLFVVPGSHRIALQLHDYLPNAKDKTYYGVSGFENVSKVNLIMEKGDTVFFHPILLHGSGPNLTKGFRRAISCHYADSNCTLISLRGTTQENIAKVTEKLFRKKLGGEIKYEDYVKLKSRLLRGSPGNFQKLDSHL